MGPDPYREWLAIETDHEAPNHYELLGLALFTGDSAAVRQAFEDRYALVRRYEGGNYGDRALALLAELSDAFKCLTNEDEKSHYDQELRETLALRETRTDAGEVHETLVEQIDELEDIVETELQDDSPPGVAAPSIPDAWAELSAPAASSYLASPKSGPISEKAGKREVAIPVWVAALCTCGAGLFVIGAIAVAFSLFGSRDPQDPTAQVQAPAVAATNVVADDSDPVVQDSPSPDSGDVSESAERSGRLARVLIDGGGTLHLLVASSDRLFEARSRDRDLIQQVADFVCLAEDAAFADEVKVVGMVADNTASFFDPEQRLRGDLGEMAVLDLRSVELVEKSRSGNSELTAEDQQTLLSLRSVGQYARFVATVTSPFESTSRRFRATFYGRNYFVEIPDAWRAVGVEISQGQQITVVTRTTRRYESPARGGSVNDMLLLEVETINQPSFPEFVESPTQVTGSTVVYQATVRPALLKDNQATLNVEIQHAGKSFSIKGLAGISAGHLSFVKGLDGRAPLLVELKAEKADSAGTYKVVSLTRLNDAADRVVFDEIVASKPEPMPLAERSVPKPPASLALADLPDYVDLPPLASQVPQPLTPAVEFAGVEIELACELIAMDAEYRFVTKQVDGAQPQWEVYLQKTLDVGTQEALVAHLATTDKRLAFRWDDNANELTAGQLRNCLLRLKSGGQSHYIALRSPLRLGATGLPSEEAKFHIPFGLEDPPSPDRLSMDVEVTYGGSKIESTARTATAARGKRLDFKVDELQDVEIQVVLISQQDKTLVLHASPRMQLGTSRQLTLSTEGVDDHEQRIQQSGIKAEKSLVKAQNMLQSASSSYSRAGTSAARARFSAIMDTQRKAIAANQQNLYEMKQALDSVSTLRAAVDAVQSKTLIQYRVYAEAEDTRLLLVDGGYREADALSKPVTSEPSADAAAIDGLWQLVRFEVRGRPYDRPGELQLRLENGQYSCQVGSSNAQGAYQIDASTPSPTITFDGFRQTALRQLGVFMQSGTCSLSSNGTELSIAFGSNRSQAGDFAAIASGGGPVAVYRRVE